MPFTFHEYSLIVEGFEIMGCDCSADATNSTAKPTQQAAWRSPDVRSDRSDGPDETVLTEADSQTIWISNPTTGLRRPPLRPNAPLFVKSPSEIQPNRHRLRTCGLGHLVDMW